MKTSKKLSELRKEFSYITSEEIKFRMENNEYKTEKGFLNYLGRKNKDYETRANMPHVKNIEIELSWSNKNSYGAMCPRASMRWEDSNGWHYEENAAYASGWGYDKTSTVIAECLNKVCSGMLYQRKRARKVPYGISFRGFFPYFEGGVGESCYYSIANFLGGKMEHVANGKKYDKFVFTFK